MKVLILLLISFSSSAQINVRSLGAVGNGVVDDYAAIQKAIDSAVKTHGKVYLPKGRYKISKPLLVYYWDGKKYAGCSIELYGDSRMWDMNNNTVILPDFKDCFAIGLQTNKGTIIRGIEIRGKYKHAYDLKKHYLTELNDYNADPTCRDSRYSPYAGIVIDPFSHFIPSDGGYPGLSQFYRGANAGRAGSTGVRIEDVTVDKFVIGFIVSPNGYTLNGEIITWQNIRLGDCKIGFVGCQAQEKENRIINLGAWGYTHTLFAWGIYGAGQPGHYIIDGVNVAGFVRQLVYRPSQDWFPLNMTNVFAERLFTVGIWNGFSGDSFTNSTVDFMDLKEVPAYPNAHIMATGNTRGVSLSNVILMYYGQYKKPVFLRGKFPIFNSPNRAIYANPIHAYRYNDAKPDTALIQVANIMPVFYDSASNKKLVIPVKNLSKGDIMFFVQANNNDYVGMGEIESSGKWGSLIRYCSPGLKNGIAYRIFKYKR